MSRTSMALTACCLLMGGCPTTPPATQTSIDVVAGVSLDDFSSEVSISSAFFSFSEISFVSDVNIEGNKLPAEQIISDQTDGDFFFGEIDPGFYSRIEIKLNRPNPTEPLPDAFNGEPLSLLLEGSAQLGGQTFPLRIQDSRPVPNMNVLLEQGVDILPGDTAQVALDAKISRLFEGVSFQALTPQDLTDNSILLDLSDQPYLNDHPNLQEIANLINNNLEIFFSVAPLP